MVDSNRNSGWFVEIPTEMKEEFKRLYPGRRQMKLLTLAAIRYAIEQRPANLSHIPTPEKRED